ncbi:MAG: hypothetical protein LHV68_02030 [Elusimicrobia bacterium]|nr:hypothetical protein [Candidatus Liberimonas magnetica]
MENQKYVDDEIDLLEILVILYKYRAIVISLVILVSMITGVSSLNKTPKYEATASFFCLDALKNSSNQNLAGSAVNSDLVISILESRAMKDRIIDELNLVKLWPSDFRENIREKIVKATNISIEKGNIIKIRVITENPEISMNIANLYLNEIDAFNKKLELSANASITQILDRAILPEKRMARGTIKKIILAAIISFLLSCFLVLIIDMLKKSDAINKLTQIKG